MVNPKHIKSSIVSDALQDVFADRQRAAWRPSGKHSRPEGPPTRYLSHDEMDRQTLDMWGFPATEHNLRVMRLPRSRNVRVLLVRVEA